MFRYEENIGLAGVYGGIAEEAAELAAASAKMERILRGDNPAGIDEQECKNRVVTELTHVLIYCADIGLFPNNVIADDTNKRAKERMMKKT